MNTRKQQIIKLIKEVAKEVINENQMPVPSTDQKNFAEDIVEKIRDRQRKKGFSDLNISEAIRQMIEFKLAKEGWIRRGVELTDKPSADGATYNITPA